jgi:cell division protein FtsB
MISAAQAGAPRCRLAAPHDMRVLILTLLLLLAWLQYRLWVWRAAWRRSTLQADITARRRSWPAKGP